MKTVVVGAGTQVRKGRAGWPRRTRGAWADKCTCLCLLRSARIHVAAACQCTQAEVRWRAKQRSQNSPAASDSTRDAATLLHAAARLGGSMLCRACQGNEHLQRHHTPPRCAPWSTPPQLTLPHCTPAAPPAPPLAARGRHLHLAAPPARGHHLRLPHTAAGGGGRASGGSAQGE